MAISLRDKGYSALNIQVPSFKDLADIAKLSGPLILTMISKVYVFDKLTRATSMHFCIYYPFFVLSLAAVTRLFHLSIKFDSLMHFILL
jgi:uncharacterized secreted protein with C-terminal beta-propeller domain